MDVRCTLQFNRLSVLFKITHKESDPCCERLKVQKCILYSEIQKGILYSEIHHLTLLQPEHYRRSPCF